MHDMKRKKDFIAAIDLFCGVGGLTHGLERAGIEVRLGVDIDPACEYPFTANNKAKFLLRSVEDLGVNDLKQFYKKGEIKLLAGCAPCQTFSTYNQKADESDNRWWLLKHFSRLVSGLLPELVTMENVPGLEDQNVFHQFVSDLRNDGYSVNYGVINCAQYGIPQKRNRLVLLASQIGPLAVLTPEQFGNRACSVMEAIGKLPPIKAGSTHPDDPLHRSSELSDINLLRIRASKPGGTWRDWPNELLVKCHTKSTGKTYPSVYGRMSWDEPSPTITTQFYGYGNGRFGHPEQDRAISLREGAILQSFPIDYKFTRPGDPILQRSIGRLIGNAVPVTLGEVIGASLLKHISASIRKGYHREMSIENTNGSN